MLSDIEELPSVQLGDYTLRFELEDLTPFGKEVARDELRETPELKASAIEELRELLKGIIINYCPISTNKWPSLAKDIFKRFLKPCFLI